MEPTKETKRKKDRNNEDDETRREKKSKRARSKSRSPPDPREKDSKRKRKHSRSQSPDKSNKQEKQNDRSKNVKSEPPARKVKETDMLNTRTGGAYIPPARLRMMQAQITDKSSIAYQRLAWEALKKSIHGHINKINVGNIGIIIKELLKENIVRGRGLLCRSVIQAQAASPTFTNVYAALVAAVNSRFPNIGELLLKRLVIQFKRGFKRNDKAICISAASFIAHLVNQRVAHEILALELLTLLVETPSDDSVEVAIAFLKECGQKLTEVSSKGVNAIFEMLRNILHEGQLDKRVQYMIEVMFQVWKDGFKDHPALLEELELVPEEEQFTHLLMLDDATDAQDILNVFKHDEKYEENEQKYKTLSKEILGSDADSDEGSGESGSEESDEGDEEETTEQKEMTIIDNTETNLVALRRTIYLTINSSLDFEECAHKLMKMQLKPGQEVELCHMFLDCCAEQRTYEKFYGLLAQRFCNLNRIYIGPFEEIFKDSYSTAHRLDTNRLRNVSKFFAHLLFTDSISWEVLECVKLNEEDTTSSSRIYIKILFQELAEYMGLKKLNDRLKDPTLQGAFQGVFPRDNPKNTRFSINFFTTIGLGGLTDNLREHLKQMPKNVAPPPEINLESGSSSDSSSSSSSSDSSDSSSSDSEDDSSKKKRKDKKKSNKEKKDKTPKTAEEPGQPKEKERWGHDGFYDNYGKDARRHERDKENFVIPQMPRRNDKRSDDKRDQRNNNEEKRNDRDRRSDDERPRRDRDDERNDRSRDKDDRSRKNKDDDRRDKERNFRDDRDDRGDNSKDEKKDRERNSRVERDDREKHSKSNKEKSFRDVREDRKSNSRAERDDRERDARGDQENSSRDVREAKETNSREGKEKSSRHDTEDSSRDLREERGRNSRAEKEGRERDSRGDKENGSRDVREAKETNSKAERKDREKDSRVQKEGRDKLSTDDKKRNSRAEKEGRGKESKVDKEKSSRDVTEDRERNSRADKEDKERYERVENEDRQRPKKSSKDERREEKRDKKSRRKDIEDESEKYDDRRDKDRRTVKSKYREVSDDREQDRYTERDEIRRIGNKENRMEGTTRIEINGEYKKIERGMNKDRNTAKIKGHQSDSDTSDSDSSSSSSSSSSSGEDDKHQDDGWDIRGASIRREIVGRYWDLPKDRKRETVERSPPRESRRHL